MRFRITLTLAVAVVVTVVFAMPLAAQNSAGVIQYRQKVMGAISGHFGGVGQVVKNKLAYKDHIKGHAEAIAALAELLPEIFPEGSGTGKTDALPKIWKDKSGFESAARKLRDEARKLALVAASGDMGAIAAQVKATGKKGCGGCHKKFRQPKKKRYAWKKK